VHNLGRNRCFSLWLATFAKDHPFTFVDHTLRGGDSLVGLTAHQVEAFHWQPKEEGALLRDMPSRLRHILNARAQIFDAADETPYETLAQKLAVTEEQMIDLRLAGDLTIAAFFAADKPQERETRRKDLAEKFRRAQERVTDLELENELQGAVRVLKTGQIGITPFHWELEFPEVFRLNEHGSRASGFNAFVGNPPFLGGKKISTNLLPTYRDWLATMFENSNSNSDLVCYFFRRAFELLNLQGGLGLIATNSVSQGATRATGLYYIVKHGGEIFAARKRVAWPGEAAVEVCIIHIWSGPFYGARYLNGRAVANISAFLVEKGGDDDPFVLRQNAGKSFIGYELHGIGFMFDDRSGEANPMSVLEDLAARNPSVRERVFPFIGGAEVNENPIGRYPRLAMNFGSMTLDEALQWRELVDLLRQKVKPTRPARSIIGTGGNINVRDPK